MIFERLEGAISRFDHPEPWMVIATEDIPRVWRDIVSESIENLEDDAVRALMALWSISWEVWNHRVPQDHPSYGQGPKYGLDAQ